MVSRRKPGDADEPDWGKVRSRLDALVEQHLSELVQPWQEALARAPDAQAEIDRTVQPLRVFFNKWVVEILVVLGQRDTIRFNQLKSSLEGISGRTLSQRLRELEEQGLVSRDVHNEMPVRVEYSLTEKGLRVAALALPLVLYLRLESDPAGSLSSGDR